MHYVFSTKTRKESAHPLSSWNTSMWSLGRKMEKWKISINQQNSWFKRVSSIYVVAFPLDSNECRTCEMAVCSFGEKVYLMWLSFTAFNVLFNSCSWAHSKRLPTFSIVGIPQAKGLNMNAWTWAYAYTRNKEQGHNRITQTFSWHRQRNHCWCVRGQMSSLLFGQTTLFHAWTNVRYFCF